MTAVLPPRSEMAALLAELQKLVADHKGFERIFRTVEYSWSDGYPLRGTFVYPAFTLCAVDLDRLIDYLLASLVEYCIPRSEAKAIQDQAFENKDRQALVQLNKRAEAAFMTSRKELDKGGEVGELILFSFIERLLGAPLLVSKMNLKTNQKMPVHGRDGIHISFDTATKTLILLLGESKLEKAFSSAADSAIKSIRDYVSDSKLREHEINILRSHCDFGPMPAWAQTQLRALLNPYGGGAPDAAHVHACLVGFELDAFAKVAAMKPQDVENAFKTAYLERIKSGCTLLKQKAGKDLEAGMQIHFFLLPLPSLAKLREIFLQKLGVTV